MHPAQAWIWVDRNVVLSMVTGMVIYKDSQSPNVDVADGPLTDDLSIVQLTLEGKI